MTDLVILAADKSIEFTLKGLLEERCRALGIRSDIHYEIRRHPEQDSGCYRNAHEFLRPDRGRTEKALVVFDLKMNGAPEEERTELEASVEDDLSRSGWNDEDVCCIVIDPDLEVWTWTTSHSLNRCIGWEDRSLPVQAWAKRNGYWQEGEIKPNNPKETFILALKEVGRQRSAVIFYKIAATVSVRNCQSPSFNKLKQTLQNWFGESRDYE